MKKNIITWSFIVAFIGYSLYQRFGVSGTTTYLATTTSEPIVSTIKNNLYADGTYTGNVVDAFYCNIQVQATIQNGKIADVQFLQYPNDRDRSIRINGAAMPILKSGAISAQSANVDIVSGATDSSRAFMQSLSSALAQTKN